MNYDVGNEQAGQDELSAQQVAGKKKERAVSSIDELFSYTAVDRGYTFELLGDLLDHIVMMRASIREDAESENGSN
jgi:hypothetical protein